MSTYAGTGEPGSVNGASAAAIFNRPQALAIDATGDVFVTELDGYAVRRISPDGDVTTVVGAGAPGASWTASR